MVGFALTRQSQRKLGTYYIYSNLLMLIAAYIFLIMGYGFFVIATPRFIHDFTAFIIYSAHDQNRNREIKHNYVYRFLSFLLIPPLVLCPVLAIVLANSIECGAFFTDMLIGFGADFTFTECVMKHGWTQRESLVDIPLSMQVGTQILFVCGLFHYYIESFVWKRDSIHRHAVKFT